MPIYACHYNEEVFPEPDKFKPERFSRENMNKLNPFLFRAFGGEDSEMHVNSNGQETIRRLWVS